MPFHLKSPSDPYLKIETLQTSPNNILSAVRSSTRQRKTLLAILSWHCHLLYRSLAYTDALLSPCWWKNLTPASQQSWCRSWKANLSMASKVPLESLESYIVQQRFKWIGHALRAVYSSPSEINTLKAIAFSKMPKCT